MFAYQKRVYMLAMVLLLLGSFYPILMGISVLRDLISLGAVSAFLMTLFFLVFGMLSGIFLCVLISDKKRSLVLTLSSVVSAVMTTAMYMGELILLDGKLYRFGDGFFFSPMGGFPFAPADLAVILLSGLLTLAAVAGLTKKEASMFVGSDRVKL